MITRPGGTMTSAVIVSALQQALLVALSTTLTRALISQVHVLSCAAWRHVSHSAKPNSMHEFYRVVLRRTRITEAVQPLGVLTILVVALFSCTGRQH
jgi:hypothetical protein